MNIKYIQVGDLFITKLNNKKRNFSANWKVWLFKIKLY